MDGVIRPVAVGGRGDAVTDVQPGAAVALELPGHVHIETLGTFGHEEHAQAVHEDRRLGGQHLDGREAMTTKA